MSPVWWPASLILPLSIRTGRQDPGRYARKHGRRHANQSLIYQTNNARQSGRPRQLAVVLCRCLQQQLICHGTARLGRWCQSDLQVTRKQAHVYGRSRHIIPPPLIDHHRDYLYGYQHIPSTPTAADLASARRTVATSLPIVLFQSDFWVCCHPTPLSRGCIGCGEARPSCPSLVNILPA